MDAAAVKYGFSVVFFRLELTVFGIKFQSYRFIRMSKGCC